MEDAVGGGAHEQSQAVATMATHNDQIGTGFIGQGVDFHLGLTEHDVPVFGVKAMACREFFQLLHGLLMNLVLNARKIHGDVPTIGEAEGLDNVDDM